MHKEYMTKKKLRKIERKIRTDFPVFHPVEFVNDLFDVKNFECVYQEFVITGDEKASYLAAVVEDLLDLNVNTKQMFGFHCYCDFDVFGFEYWEMTDDE